MFRSEKCVLSWVQFFNFIPFEIEHTATQWEIGLLRFKKVILPDFVFGFLIR
jgi:hypothetical protein